MTPLLLAMLFQAQQPAPRPAAPGVQASAHYLPPGPPGTAPRTPYDSTVAAIRRIGVTVAEVKSGLESFNRAAAREPSGTVVERGASLQTACRAMTVSAREDGHAICRSCLRGEQAAAVEQYRAYLATLARVGSQCSTIVAQQRRAATADMTALGLKREAQRISSGIVEGIVPYEQRLAAVRTAFGWTGTTSGAPRRGP